VAQYEYSASAGNDMLEQEIDGREELVGCWAILPGAAGASGENESVADAPNDRCTRTTPCCCSSVETFDTHCTHHRDHLPWEHNRLPCGRHD